MLVGGRAWVGREAFGEGWVEIVVVVAVAVAVVGVVAGGETGICCVGVVGDGVVEVFRRAGVGGGVVDGWVSRRVSFVGFGVVLWRRVVFRLRALGCGLWLRRALFSCVRARRSRWALVGWVLGSLLRWGWRMWMGVVRPLADLWCSDTGVSCRCRFDIRGVCHRTVDVISIQVLRDVTARYKNAYLRLFGFAHITTVSRSFSRGRL